MSSSSSNTVLRRRTTVATKSNPLPVASFLDATLVDSKELADACLEGNLDRVLSWIYAGANVNQHMPGTGLAPIHAACRWQRPDVLAIVLKNGADPNLLTQDGFRALGIACGSGVYAKREGIVRMLLEHGAEVDAFDSNGMAPLHNACNTQDTVLVRALLEYGANVNLPTRDGVRPLHIASSRGNQEAVQLLLRHKADMNALDANGMSPFYHACKSQNAALVATLLECGANSNPKNGVDPIHIACSHGTREIVRLLYDHGADTNALRAISNGMYPLHGLFKSRKAALVATLLKYWANLNPKNGVHLIHVACSDGTCELLRLLYDHGADTDGLDANGMSPLHRACKSQNAALVAALLDCGAYVNLRTTDRYQPLHIACYNGAQKIVQILLEHGADVDGMGFNRSRPLHIACYNGAQKIVQILLEHGADVDGTGPHRSQPLHIACYNGAQKIVQILLEHGADVDGMDFSRMAPIHAACESQCLPVVATLLDYGAYPNPSTKNRLQPLHIACVKGDQMIVQVLLEHGADANALNINNIAPIHIACKIRSSAIVAALLKFGAKVNLPANDGVYPLHLACVEGMEDVVRVLIECGADANAPTANEVYPIHTACESRCAAMVATLLRGGAHANLPTRNGVYPLHIACQAGAEIIVRMLLEYGADINAARHADGITPLHLACRLDKEHIVDLLLDQQPPAQVDVSDSSGLTPLQVALDEYTRWLGDFNYHIVQSLLRHGADVNTYIHPLLGTLQTHTKAQVGTPLLHFATRKHNVKFIQLLLSNGASPEMPDAQGQTPLQLAQKLGFSTIVELLESHRDATFFNDTLVGDCENESEFDTVDWRKLSPHDPYFQEAPTVPESSLPVHSVPEVDRARNLMGNWIKRIVAIFTQLEAFESVQVDSEFEHIRDYLTREWQQTRTWIMCIIGVDIAAYALSPDSLFQVSKIGKVAIGASGLTIGIAALCDLYLLCRFSSLEPSQFRAASTDVYGTFVCFAILSRVPLALVVVSMGFLATLLIEVAYRLSPTMTLILGVMIAALLFIQYIAMMIDWMVWIVVTLFLHFSRIFKAVSVVLYQKVFGLSVAT